jgi:hypothetical protein
MEELFKAVPWLQTALTLLGLLVVVAQTVVVITPSKKDDEYLDKLKSKSLFRTVYDFLLSFSPLAKTESGIKLNKK